MILGANKIVLNRTKRKVRLKKKNFVEEIKKILFFLSLSPCSQDPHAVDLRITKFLGS